MSRPLRSETFDPNEVAVVHCVQRCVRRAYLAGFDAVTGKSFEHRREWIRRRLELLASVFGIDVLTYAILSNHLHVVTRTRPDVVAQWSDQEVARRWLSVFPGKRLEEQLAEPTTADVETLAGNAERMAKIRTRMSDLSWFMRALSEPIARLANKQDECTGRFWEGRFKAQRITDEAGLLACSMYVDLNPIRAAMAETPEEAQHTSAYDRLAAQRGETMLSAAADRATLTPEETGEELKNKSVEQLRQKRQKRRAAPGRPVARDAWLAPLTLDRQTLASEVQASSGGLRASDKGFLEMSLEDYLQLLDWTGRQGRGGGGGGTIPERVAGILQRIGVESSMWCDLVWNFKRYFGRSAGRPDSLSRDAERTGKRWTRGQVSAAHCFCSG